MANTIVQVRRTSTSGRTPNTTASYATNSQYISAGELALNMTDQILYTSDGTNLITVGANSTSYKAANSSATGFTANSSGANVNILNSNVFAGGLTTITSGGTTTTLNSTSTYYQHIVGTTTQTIKLPDLTTIANGTTYIIDNDSTGNVTITDSAGTTLGVALTGAAGWLYSMSNATATGNWGGYAFLPVAVQWGDAGLQYKGYFAVGNTTVANSFTINATALASNLVSTFNANVVLTTPLIANGSPGTATYVLTSNGTSGAPYWNPAASGLTGSQIASNNWTFTNNISFANTITANGSVGSATYVLTSGGAGQNVYWAAATGGGSVNTANQYIFSNTISFTANVLVGGNSTSQIIVGNSTQNTVIGYNSTDFSPAEFAGNANNFIAVYVRNANTGNNASADFSVYNDSFSGAADKWIDIGINSSGYNQSTWTINGANDTYVYAGNSNLSVGANGTNYVNFFTGGTLAVNERMRIDAGGNVNIGNASSTGTQSLTIGNTSVYVTTNSSSITGTPGNTTITANGFISTFDTSGNLTVPNTVFVSNTSLFPAGNTTAYPLATVVQAALYALAF